MPRARSTKLRAELGEGTVDGPVVKTVKVKELGRSPVDITVKDDWTVSDLMESAGKDATNYTIVGVDSMDEEMELSLDDAINGYDEFVLEPHVKGGN